MNVKLRTITLMMTGVLALTGCQTADLSKQTSQTIKTAKEDSIRSRVEVNFAYPALFYTDTSLKSYQTH